MIYSTPFQLIERSGSSTTTTLVKFAIRRIIRTIDFEKLRASGTVMTLEELCPECYDEIEIEADDPALVVSPYPFLLTVSGRSHAHRSYRFCRDSRRICCPRF